MAIIVQYAFMTDIISAFGNSLRVSRRRVIMGMGAASLLSISTRASELVGLKAGEIDIAARIIDGDGCVLNSGLSVKLASIEAPHPASRYQNRLAWPFADEARAALSGLIKGRNVQLFYGGAKRDRYKRAIAHIYTLTPSGQPDLWVQEEMVRLGLARVYTWANEDVDSARLYAAEGAARAAGRGIWGHDFYAIRSPDPNVLSQYVDSSQIVEGIIVSAANVRGRIYLNFGTDYKTDFTITIAKRNVKRFTQANIDLLGLEGAHVRIRGWIELINGPSIWADHPAQLEILPHNA